MIIQPTSHHGISHHGINANAIRAKSLHANEGLRAGLHAERQWTVLCKTKRKSCLQIPTAYLIHNCLQHQWIGRNPLFANKRPTRIHTGRVAKRQGSNATKEPRADGFMVAPKPKEGVVVIKA